MKVAVAVFGKTAGLSPVKTRLAQDIGLSNAQAFYRLSVAAVAETVGTLAERDPLALRPHWAVAEPQAVGFAQWGAFPAIWTGEGALGERLHQVYSALAKSHDAVILMGTDSPQLTPAAIAEAIERLEGRPDACVIGPALDGGFYLFAAGIPLAPEHWTGVAYSEATTLNELVSRISGGGVPVAFLPARTDADTVDDLASLRTELAAIVAPSPSQSRLRDWLKTFLDQPKSAQRPLKSRGT
ncbi:TIGR04282 family arsenosugar biosynthesis glycosyltransferase [Spiribacter onubensis]|uniref:DUF2064 domain-containing protein n=1 Tax=Spiribacter onubensis TaxID=3122420 RepID=A0ABV3S8B4_9GAMM